MTRLFFFLLLALPLAAAAEPLAAPGDLRLRHDLQLLSDSGVIDVPLAAWPLALGDIHASLEEADTGAPGTETQAALGRVRAYLAWELETDVFTYRLGLAGAENPRFIRTFERTPREQGEVSAAFSWLGNRFVVNLAASFVSDPFDDDEFRPDGTYVGAVLGNWILTAGWQERWWGHGRDGSLILSTNARPTPGFAIQRNLSTPFKTRWLSWMGPWTMAGFMTGLDDPRTVNDARLFGVRGSFGPPNTGLEIGLSRTAQWCGDGRPCDAEAFVNLLLGRDNRGVNIDLEDEPGNQLAGWDARWSLPRQIPVALYMHWIGEDGRPNGVPIGSWMRQLGIEYWGSIGSLSHRTHLEVSDTLCREGGFGFSDVRPDCAYVHPIYKTGYRYRGRAIGHPADGNSLSYSIGSTLVQSAGHFWNIALRYMEINREGPPDPRHTLTPTPQELVDLQVSHQRDTRYGRFHGGIGFSRLDDLASGSSESEASAFIQWSSN
ncbi:MAG: hypothetical protein HKP32_09925 [Woeseia sp.]|nr:hypothetical protein [Woeseia sp.]